MLLEPERKISGYLALTLIEIVCPRHIQAKGEQPQPKAGGIDVL
jgi:hypothetical protein